MKSKAQPFSFRLVKASLAFVDLILIFVSFGLVFHIRMRTPIENLLGQNLLHVMVFLLMVSLFVFGSYDLEGEESSLRVLGRHGVGVLTGAAMVVGSIYLFTHDRGGLLGRGVLLGSLLVFGVISGVYRYIVWNWLKKHSQKLRWLVVGTYDHCLVFWRDLKKSGFWGNIHFLVENYEFDRNERMPIEGNWGDLDEVLDKHDWSSFIIAVHGSLPEKVSRRMLHLRLSGLKVWDLCDFYERFWRKVPIFYLKDNWFFLSEGFSLFHNPIGLRIKRVLDVIGATILFLFTFPVMVVAAIAIRLESKGPALFKQIRTGLDGKTFTMVKFRSMHLDAEKNGAQWAKKDDARITKVGKFIRLTRIDELPQLINVLAGEMSFIGPRPERPEFNELLEKQLPYYQMRHLVRPGVSGWAQVLYPYGASIEDATEKLQYELYYIKNYSLLMDAQVTLKTIAVVLFGRGR